MNEKIAAKKVKTEVKGEESMSPAGTGKREPLNLFKSMVASFENEQEKEEASSNVEDDVDDYNTETVRVPKVNLLDSTPMTG